MFLLAKTSHWMQQLFCKKKFWILNEHNNVHIYLTLLNLKVFRMVNFIMCILPQLNFTKYTHINDTDRSVKKNTEVFNPLYSFPMSVQPALLGLIPIPASELKVLCTDYPETPPQFSKRAVKSSLTINKPKSFKIYL